MHSKKHSCYFLEKEDTKTDQYYALKLTNTSRIKISMHIQALVCLLTQLIN